MDYLREFIARIDTYLAPVKALGQEGVICIGLVDDEFKGNTIETYDKDATAYSLFQGEKHSCWHRCMSIEPELLQQRGRGIANVYRNLHTFRVVFSFYNPTQISNKNSPIERVFLALRGIRGITIGSINRDPLDVLRTEGIDIQVANGYYVFSVEYTAYLAIPESPCEVSEDIDSLEV